MAEDLNALSDSDRLPDPNTTKILIGEVSLINSLVIKKFLEKLGYQHIVQVDNGEHAVAAAKNEFFNIIFLDLRMPVIGGVEATTMIRRYEAEKRKSPAAIVGLTAVYSDLETDMSVECGMNSLLTLPLHIMVLKDTLAKYVRPKKVESLKNLVMMYITNQPLVYQYYNQNHHTLYCKGKEVSISSDLVEELNEMKESFPPYYKYPKFSGMDSSEILCVVANDYPILMEHVAKAIEMVDIGAVRRSATALAAILKHVSFEAELAAVEMSKCVDCDQAQQFLETISQYME